MNINNIKKRLLSLEVVSELKELNTIKNGKEKTRFGKGHLINMSVDQIVSIIQEEIKNQPQR